MEVTCWNIIQGSGTLIIGGIAVLIAGQQWVTNRRKLKLDLFEKRYAVYEGMRELLGSFVSNNTFSEDAHRKFIIARGKSEFLFKTDVVEFIDKFSINMILLNTKKDEEYRRTKQHGTDAFTQMIEEEERLTDWFVEVFQDKKIEKMLKPYLSFSNI